MCIVDVDAPGFTRERIPMPYIGPDNQWTLFFDGVEVQADRLIGGEQGGLAAVFDGLNPERIMIAAQCNGVGRLALEKASTYASERTVWKPAYATRPKAVHVTTYPATNTHTATSSAGLPSVARCS